MKNNTIEDLTISMDLGLQLKNSDVINTPKRKRNISKGEILNIGGNKTKELEKLSLERNNVDNGKYKGGYINLLVDEDCDSLNNSSELSVERIPKRSKSPNIENRKKDREEILIEEEYKKLTSETNLPKTNLNTNMKDIFPSGSKYANKNRYNNVFPTESTRVKLKTNKKKNVKTDDYINANYINSYNNPQQEKKPKFISCQAPLPNTFNDFYRMLWQEKSSVVICLTKMVEKGKKKAERYFPEMGEIPMKFADFEISFISYSCDPSFSVYSLNVQKLKNKKSRKISLILFFDWPDFGVPTSSLSILKLESAYRYYSEITKSLNGENINGPPIVHCSAGLGRTGCFVAICFSLEYLRNNINGKINVYQTVKHIRAQRYGSIQTKSQYSFIYSVVKDYVNFSRNKSIMSSLDISKNPPISYPIVFSLPSNNSPQTNRPQNNVNMLRPDHNSSSLNNISSFTPTSHPSRTHSSQPVFLHQTTSNNNKNVVKNNINFKSNPSNSSSNFNISNPNNSSDINNISNSNNNNPINSFIHPNNNVNKPNVNPNVNNNNVNHNIYNPVSNFNKSVDVNNNRENRNIDSLENISFSFEDNSSQDSPSLQKNIPFSSLSLSNPSNNYSNNLNNHNNLNKNNTNPNNNNNIRNNVNINTNVNIPQINNNSNENSVNNNPIYFTVGNNNVATTPSLRKPHQGHQKTRSLSNISINNKPLVVSPHIKSLTKITPQSNNIFNPTPTFNSDPSHSNTFSFNQNIQNNSKLISPLNNVPQFNNAPSLNNVPSFNVTHSFSQNNIPEVNQTNNKGISFHSPTLSPLFVHPPSSLQDPIIPLQTNRKEDPPPPSLHNISLLNSTPPQIMKTVERKSVGTNLKNTLLNKNHLVNISKTNFNTRSVPNMLVSPQPLNPSNDLPFLGESNNSNNSNLNNEGVNSNLNLNNNNNLNKMIFNLNGIKSPTTNFIFEEQSNPFEDDNKFELNYLLNQDSEDLLEDEDFFYGQNNSNFDDNCYISKGKEEVLK
eukprot:TRINITY_DN5286_c2_g1_i2.p1 TRINITY_DN5286_c2_g1~~TRINITY_DN5286_c2_g1_i2.p1  ORF type:complete len:1017 (-),score=306.15 TRINITY_DN5286_c2_g1_i2:18-3041(-)